MERAAKRLREMVSKDDKSPVLMLIGHGVLRPLIDCLTEIYDPYHVLQNEVLWIMINILTKIDQNNESIRTSKLHEEIMRHFRRDNYLPIAENVLF
jgi:hypothetical protein